LFTVETRLRAVRPGEVGVLPEFSELERPHP
jgi:hypothetical protein